jgi:hypothetical protein
LVVVFIRKNCIRMFFCLFCFLGFARRIFYPALSTLLYFIILVVAIYHSNGAQKNQDKNEQFKYNLRSMLILRFFVKIAPESLLHQARITGSCLPIFIQFIQKFYKIVEHPLDPPVCINMHPFLMSIWSGSCILITY